MNALDESKVREQLQQAVEVLDPAAPPFREIQARATKRRRTFRLAGGLGGLALAGACAIAAVAVINAGGGGQAQVTQPAAPSGTSLAAYAKAHGGIKSFAGVTTAGPFENSAGYYGEYLVNHGVRVTAWNGAAWRSAGAVVTKLGYGRFVTKLANGPAIGGQPSLYVAVEGGDVSYFGSVLVDGANGWQAARFGRCGHHKLCYPSDSEPYGNVHSGKFVSINNSCRPNCAAGNTWKIRWTWVSARTAFIAARVHRYTHS